MALRVSKIHNLKAIYDVGKTILAPSTTQMDFVRYRRTKHWDPRWKWMRRAKVMKVELPNLRQKPDDLTEEQIRSRLKERGLLPSKTWVERPFYISNTGVVFEPYVPPEGDGKVSPITTQGAKQKLEFLEKKSKTMMAIRKVRQFEEEFRTEDFCKTAEEVYLKMHECIAEKDEEKARDFVTEKALSEVMHNIKNKTIRWKYLKNIELPRVVHARCTHVISKENVFAQLTVRFHTQQVLAVYDRFGRLIHGSEILAKDVLEYVVFEKHLANEYGIWRVHHKIIPDWLPPREPTALTYKKQKEESEPIIEEAALKIQNVASGKNVESQDSPPKLTAQ